MSGFKTTRKWMRQAALPMAACFAWSVCLAPAAYAAAARPPVPPGHTRPLSTAEMRRITGRTYPTGMSPEPGSPYAWSGNAGGANTGNGNKRFSTTLVGWKNKGGLPIDFTLTHNSRSARGGEVGPKWTHSFDLRLDNTNPGGQLTVHWGDDRAYQFVENMDGSYTAPAGIHDTLVKVNGTTWDLTTKDQVTYRFQPLNSSAWNRYCTRIQDANGNTVTFNRSYMSTVLNSITDSSSRTLSFTYTNGKITTVTDPMSREWTLSYDGNGRLSEITWPAVGGNTYTEEFEYDTGGNSLITTYTDRRGKEWDFGYDGSCRITSAADPEGNTVGYSYPSSTQTVITDANSNDTTHDFDSSGRLETVTDALSNTEVYEWDGDNNKTQVTDRRGKVWTFEFDGNGNCTESTNPLNKTTTQTWNSKNRPLVTTTPLGNQVVNTYDSTLGWNLEQTQLKNSGGTVLSTTAYAWNGDGTLDEKTDDNSNTTQYGYSSNGDLISLTTPDSHVWEWDHNTLGVVDSRTDALTRETNLHAGQLAPDDDDDVPELLHEDVQLRRQLEPDRMDGRGGHVGAHLRRREPDPHGEPEQHHAVLLLLGRLRQTGPALGDDGRGVADVHLLLHGPEPALVRGGEQREQSHNFVHL